MVRFEVPGQPKGKGRHRSRVGMLPGGRAVARQYPDDETVSEEARVAACAQAVLAEPMPFGQGEPVEMVVTAIMAVPSSWSKRKQADALAGIGRPTGKPDASNILKLLEDALNSVVWHDDAQLVGVVFRKVYGERPRLEVCIRRAEMPGLLRAVA